MEDYYKIPYISQTMLTDLSYSPRLFKKKYIDKSIDLDEKKEHFTIGSAVDCKLLTPEDYDDRYVVVKESSLTPQLNTLLENVYSKMIIEELGLEDSDMDNLILNEIDTLGLMGNIVSDSKKLDKVYSSKFFEFLSERIEHPNKTLLTKEQQMLVDSICNSLLTNEFTGSYFISDDKKFDEINQMIILWEYLGVKCKSMLDKVRFYHDDKKIQIIDLKTTSDYTEDFPKSVIKYRGDIQGAFYTDAVEWWIKNDPKAKRYRDYTVESFKFVVESTTIQGAPLIWYLTGRDINMGRKGGFIKSWNKQLKGYQCLLKDMIWHSENGLWDYPREIYEKEGKIAVELEAR